MTTPFDMTDLDVEPPPAVVGDVLPPEPEALALAASLPADFPLLTLLRFVPDVRLKQRVAVEAAAAAAIDLKAPDGLTRADAAIDRVKGAIADAERAFVEPVGLANQLHKRLTGLRADFCKAGMDVVAALAPGIIAERRRRVAAAENEQRILQAKADADARADAERAAAEAKQRGALPSTVKAMKEAAKAATAPPVAAPLPPPLARSSIAEKWRARLKGTPADAEPNPTMAQLPLAQQQQVRKMMRDIADGKGPLLAFEINWSYLNSRAGSDKSALDVPEIEAFDEGSLRGKPRTARRGR